MIQLQFVLPVLLQAKPANQTKLCGAFCGANKRELGWNYKMALAFEPKIGFQCVFPELKIVFPLQQLRKTNKRNAHTW